MYVCGDCFKEHQLKVGKFNMSCIASCELCGPLKDDWSRKFVSWEGELSRSFTEPDQKQFMLDQLEARKEQ